MAQDGEFTELSPEQGRRVRVRRKRRKKDDLQPSWSFRIGVVLVVLGAAGLAGTWIYRLRPAPSNIDRALAPLPANDAPRADGVPAGTVWVTPELEQEWGVWNGQYRMFAQKRAAIGKAEDLRGRKLMIPGFTFASFQAEQAGLLRQRAEVFAKLAGMTVEPEKQMSLFRARLLSEEGITALVPELMADQLALESYSPLQRLVPMKKP